jgi:hypothetical protein
MYQFMNVKKYRVRFVSPRKTVIVYATDLQSAKTKAIDRVKLVKNQVVTLVEAYRV